MPRILCVDDDPGVLLATEEILEGAGYEVVGVRNAEAALTAWDTVSIFCGKEKNALFTNLSKRAVRAVSCEMTFATSPAPPRGWLMTSMRRR